MGVGSGMGIPDTDRMAMMMDDANDNNGGGNRTHQVTESVKRVVRGVRCSRGATAVHGG